MRNQHKYILNRDKNTEESMGHLRIKPNGCNCIVW